MEHWNSSNFQAGTQALRLGGEEPRVLCGGPQQEISVATANSIPRQGSDPEGTYEMASLDLNSPSFRIFPIRVVRLRPSFVAAPLGPPITQFASLTALKI